MPQPMSTPTAAGMIARLVAITLPTVAPLPRCTSGITATWRWMNGRRAMRSSWARASASNGTPTVQALIGLALGARPRPGARARLVVSSSSVMAGRVSAAGVPAAADRAPIGRRPGRRACLSCRIAIRYTAYSMSRRRLTVVRLPGRDPRPGQAGPVALGEVAARPSSLCQHEDLLVDRLVLLHSRALQRAGRVRRRRHPAGVARDRGAAGRRSRSPTPGTSRRSTARCATSPAASPSTPTREDYLVPHHHRARTSRRSACSCWSSRATCPARLIQTSPAPPGPGRRAGRGHLQHHRPRPVAVRQHRPPLPEGAHRGPVVPEGRHRDPERRPTTG